MRSSISNSKHQDRRDIERDFLPPPGSTADRQRVRRATVILLALMVALLTAAELGTRVFFPRISRIERRIEGDEREVMMLKTDPDPRPAVLLVGNSLLLNGLDYPRIRAELAPQAQVVRYVIEQTAYLDWYYGLRRLFAEGVKPAKVVLCLNPNEILTPVILGEYSARHLFAARDLLAVARDAGLDTTQTSNLVVAHWSVFYASRATIRNFILNSTARRYAATLHALGRVPPAYPPDAEMIARSRIRLRAIAELCRNNGADFTLLLPPALSQHEGPLVQAGNLEHVDVDIPVPAGALGPEFFRDGFHLNEQGAVIFTDALAGDLRSRLHAGVQP
jgi:hypothetical protein